MMPKARAASASKGKGSKVASACWSTLVRRARSTGSAAWWGPADSSARVTALITISSGSCAGSRAAKCTMMLVSIRPRLGVSPGTVERVLVGDGVQVAAELVRVEHRGGGERGDDLFARDEGPFAQRDQASDRCAVAGDREGLAAFDSTHDRGRLVAEFTLGDLLRSMPSHKGHATTIALQVCYGANRQTFR